MWRQFVFVYRCCGSKDGLLSITPYLSGGDQGAEKGRGELRWADPEGYNPKWGPRWPLRSHLSRFLNRDAFIAHCVLLLPFGNQGKAALIIETNVSPVGVDSIVGESRVLRLLLAKAAERGEPLDCSHCRCSATCEGGVQDDDRSPLRSFLLP
jgi:hypothetical protein